MTEPVYPFVAVDVPRDRAEELGAHLFDLGAMGVEERDEQTLAKGAGSGKVTLVASFSTREEADEAIAALVEEDPSLAPRIEEIVGDAWRDAWKQHFEPFQFTSDVVVVPPWVAYEKKRADEHVLELEPGRAFGTGLHATTALVAEILHDRKTSLAGARVLDVGTGSGILALVALIYGAASALAIDNDAEVIDVVRENAERNGLADRVVVREQTIEHVTETFPVVLANIETRVLRPIAEDLTRAVAPSGLLILSGILAAEHDEIVARYTSLARPLRHLETRRRGDGTGDDWVAIAFAAS
ncbi:50S ribosomal protein L11 methyltransferase [Polyangium sp. 6x1]|uniref:50S ribosomal protein L11 methyltransferase n=1 Tax=Polyangium sp. 6x1 TaxID=3042689 RepID=UPI0024831DA9|nr:50S ribosomal protein L11 methyltransferase [Polyangium sp. 6x1]MDI1447879.1 50S ribosomal protein L11 methyltransferase [Polyangium sp. 6x1]